MDLESGQEHFRAFKSSIYSTPAHLWDGTPALSQRNQAPNAWIAFIRSWLDQGKIAKLLPPSYNSNTDADWPKIRNEADYFATNAARMKYPKFRQQHLFLGSGVIEAACKTVIGHRLKQSGMFWTVKGANSILALRCSHLNGRFEDYWESRRAA